MFWNQSNNQVNQQNSQIINQTISGALHPSKQCPHIFTFSSQVDLAPYAERYLGFLHNVIYGGYASPYDSLDNIKVDQRFVCDSCHQVVTYEKKLSDMTPELCAYLAAKLLKERHDRSSE